MIYGRQTAHPLQVVVVGGGTAGCAVAYTLAKAGHEVAIIDRGQHLGNGEAPIDMGGMQHIGPNGLKVLYEWDEVGPELERTGWNCDGIEFYHYDTEERIGQNPFHPDLVRDSGAPSVYTTHGQLHRALRGIAQRAGCAFLAGPLISYTPSSTDSPNTLLLADGQTLSPDLVVGADGSFSVVRRGLFPEHEMNARKGRPCTIAMIGKDKLRSKGLEHVLDDTLVRIWPGDDKYAEGCPSGDGSAYCLELHYPTITPHSNGSSTSTHADGERSLYEEMSGNWRQQTITRDVKDLFAKNGPVVSGMLEVADVAYTSVFYDLPPLEQFHWCAGEGHLDDDSSERPHALEPDRECGAVLIGDAAHPALPGAINGFSMALEDAQVLGSLFSRYNPTRPMTTLPSLLSTYTQIRLDRTHRIHYNELARYQNCTVPYNDEMNPAGMTNNQLIQFRNESIKKAGDAEMYGGDAMREEITAIWSYDATDVVEDWWIRWRAPFEKSAAAAALTSVSSLSVNAEGVGSTGGTFWGGVQTVTVEHTIA